MADRRIGVDFRCPLIRQRPYIDQLFVFEFLVKLGWERAPAVIDRVNGLQATPTAIGNKEPAVAIAVASDKAPVTDAVLASELLQ